jgi:hypothetical protein
VGHQVFNAGVVWFLEMKDFTMRMEESKYIKLQRIKMIFYFQYYVWIVTRNQNEI